MRLEDRLRASRAVIADGAPIRRHADLAEDEYLLQSDLAFHHPHHLRDAHHLASAAAQPLGLHDDVDGGRDLAANGTRWKLCAGQQDQRLETAEAVARVVRVQGAHRPVVPGVHRLQHVERLWAAALADDDPVRAHAKTVANQVADRDGAAPLDVLWLGLEADHVNLAQAELRRVLTGDDALVGWDEAGEDVEQ